MSLLALLCAYSVSSVSLGENVVSNWLWLGALTATTKSTKRTKYAQRRHFRTTAKSQLYQQAPKAICPCRATMTAMNPSLAVYSGLKSAGIDFASSVPCVNLQGLLDLVARDPDIIHIPATREEEAVGLCAGAWMGGRRAALLMQNSGLGNCINALASLDMLYGIPLLMIISHRGGVGESITGQVPMGRLTEPLLDAMSIPHITLPPGLAEEAVAGAVAGAWDQAAAQSGPAAVLLDLLFWRVK